MNFMNSTIVVGLVLGLAACGKVTAPEAQKIPERPVSFLSTPVAGLIHGMDFTNVAATMQRSPRGLQVRLANREVDLCNSRYDMTRHSEIVVSIPEAVGLYQLDPSAPKTSGQLLFIEGASSVPVIYQATIGRIALERVDDDGATGKLYLKLDDDNFVNGTFEAKSCAKMPAFRTKVLPPRVDFR